MNRILAGFLRAWDPPAWPPGAAGGGRGQRGLPIGNLTSQLWANCFLNPFDHFIKRELRCRGYVRYVDDFLLFGDSTAELREWHTDIVERLAHFRLTIHPGAHPRPVTEGIPFLGFVTWPDHRRLKRRKGVHFARKWRRLLRERECGRVDAAYLGAVASAWANHLSQANTVGLRKSILSLPFLPDL